jgi:peptide/nickel transport system substrate-binding protein
VSRRSLRLALVVVTVAAAGFAVSAPGTTATAPNGGIFRISFAQQAGLDYIDPALSFTTPGWALIDTYCARLLTHPDKPPPEGFEVVPEVAVAWPRVSRDQKVFTFTLRKDFRFSDGKPVRANAFAHAIYRTLAPNVRSLGSIYTRDIVGAGDVLSGRSATVRGVVARGHTLTIRLARPDPDFPKRLTLPFFCAVPPGLPPDREGVGAPLHSAGPYYVTEYRPLERVVIRRNPYYRGKRSHHVDGFDVDLRTALGRDMILQVDRGEADWGHLIGAAFFDPSLGLAQKYVTGTSRFFVGEGLGIRMLAFNTKRPLFRDNPALRKAINFALDRQKLQGLGGALASPATDQYLPYAMPGFQAADIYPLMSPDLTKAKALATGNLRSGKVVLLTPNFLAPLATAQLVAQQLEPLGLEVTLYPVPLHITSAQYLDLLADPDAGWDIANVIWAPNLADPSSYVSLLLNGRVPGSETLTRFSSARYDGELRRIAGLRDPRARQRAYGELDIRLARDEAPVAAFGVSNEVTFVSDRVGCIVRRPVLVLTAVCLRK